MTLSRRYLEEGQMRALYVAAVAEDRALTDEQLSASLTATLAKKPKGAGWWVFGYGSLLWNPLFPIAEARAGIVYGLHRRFCLRSLASRGTPDQPGLVLALEPGGACQGVVYRLPSPLALDELHLLWRREMVVAAYHPRWIQVHSGDRRITALTFVVRRDHVQYARLSHEEETVVIAQACGAFGSSCDYLMRTRAALASHGIVDRYLEQLARDVQRRQLACAAPVVSDVK
ncbi:MAG: gamma-glutamylcyclotransferase [Betaproteobacteria bacterium]|nr:MAG: gamma-glutamylcyclotransferase [Betaproteobacteria bacterium]TMH64564.1 MAG: gamma-glutamylcyclotransferase [Betaproteobacteria bacterium]